MRVDCFGRTTIAQKSTVVIPSLVTLTPAGLDTQLQLFATLFWVRWSDPASSVSGEQLLYDGHGKFVFWTADQTQQSCCYEGRNSTARSPVELRPVFDLTVDSDGRLDYLLQKPNQSSHLPADLTRSMSRRFGSRWTATSSAPWLAIDAWILWFRICERVDFRGRESDGTVENGDADHRQDCPRHTTRCAMLLWSDSTG